VHRFTQLLTRALGDGDLTAMTVLVCGAEPAEILDALNGALLTDEEMGAPQQWSRYQDPFGDWHEDPCDETSGVVDETSGVVEEVSSDRGGRPEP
jgi:hypothetical protein